MLITDDIADIRSIVENTRKLVLNATNGTSSGTCLYVSLSVAQSIRHNCPMINVQYRGGGGVIDGGIRDIEGNLQGHYWLEISDSEGNCAVVDSTADQFGYEKVEIVEMNNNRYLPGDQNVVNAHFYALMEELADMESKLS